MNFPASKLSEFLGTPVTQQKNLVLIFILVIISFHPTNSQSLSSSPTDDVSNSPDSVTNIQPSLVIVVAVLAIMFSLTFCLFIYANCCHISSSSFNPRYSNQENFGELPRSLSRVPGVDKTVIESLPFFRFSTLKGWRNGLECSICLSKFEDIEILRLLPKCKHAFHIDCVDRWLEKHSGCPLCRCKVSEEDAALFKYSSSLRFLSNQSDHDHRAHEFEGSNLELFIEREGSTRFGSGRSVSKIEIKNQEILENDDQEILHKFNHRIIISDYDNHHVGLMMKNRWSNMSSSDLIFLKSEMITSLSSNILDDDHNHHQMITSTSSNILDHHRIGENPNHQAIKIKEEIKRKREFEKKIKRFPLASGKSDIESFNESKSTKLVEKRSMSEIIVHPRFLEESSNYKEERLKKLWLPIARRTVLWFGNRDQQPN